MGIILCSSLSTRMLRSSSRSTTTTTTMSSCLYHPMCSSLSTNLLSTKEALNAESLWRGLTYVEFGTTDFYGLRSNLLKNLFKMEFVQEFATAVRKVVFIQYCIFFINKADIVSMLM